MAEIFIAQAPDQRDPVVVKVISRERANDENYIHMFLDEARLVSTLNHPNIARLVEVGKDGKVYFLAMELVRGETVRAILEKNARARTPVPHAVVLGIAAKVAQALHHAHERRGLNGAPLDIVHRDITPSNVMVGFDGVVKLLDFGIARAKGRSQETVSGTVKGKFAYMAPEQCLGKKVDRRADVFSLGILMYELSTLRRAFRAETDYETLQKIVKGEIAPPSSLVPGFPPAFEAVIQRAMSLDLETRYQTAAEAGAAIEALAAELGGGFADVPELRAFMRERFPEGASAAGGDVVVEAVEPAIPRTRTPSYSGPSNQSGPVPSFFPQLVPAPPREQRITGSPPAIPSAPQEVPPAVRQAEPVSLPPPPEPDRGLPWALPVALVAIAVVTIAIVVSILLT
jgi:serine/threonine-protein kinase